MQRRAFTQLPEFLQTEQNNREFYIADDPLFEPEASKFITGYVGDTSLLTEADIRRTPVIAELDAIRQKYQLGVGVALYDQDTAEYVSGAFYPDLIRHLAINGAIISDPNRLFETRYYAWRPPVDYDRLINFARYFWIGEGNAQTRGEYITKEAAGSQSCVHRFDGSTFERIAITVVDGLPGSAETGDIVEDASTASRLIYIWNGSIWTLLNYRVIADVSETTGFQSGDYAYVCRTGPDFNRPLVWAFKEKAGRWISIPVVVNSVQPDVPRIGMIWEDATALPDRVFRIYTTNGWQPLSWSVASGPTGVPADQTYIYDIRDLSEITDEWSRNNWWRAYEDLSASDRAALPSDTQAVRAIIEFWGNIEAIDGDVRDGRNDFPVFSLYAHNNIADEIQAITPSNFTGLDSDTAIGSTIFQYRIGSSIDDVVLGFPVVYASDGQFQFDLTLESQTITVNGTALPGYRMFKDMATGFVHSIWVRSSQSLSQTADSDGLYDLPRNLTANPDHKVLIDPTRSKILSHIAGTIAAQSNFAGTQFGSNSYRYSDQDATLGATLIDPEAALLRPMALLQSAKLDLPETIRNIAREYNKVMFRFFNRLKQLWEAGEIAAPDDVLVTSEATVVDSILSDIFVGRTTDFPFYYSDMGTYVETRITAGIPSIVDPAARPIMIPPSASRIGAVPTYKPEVFVDSDGVRKIRGHDGSLVPAFNDARDGIVIELETRFFNAVPAARRDETSTYSARFDLAGFHIDDYYGNFKPLTTATAVNEVVLDHLVETPVAGKRVFSTARQVFANSDGATWYTEQVKTDDIFFNEADQSYYIFNGFITLKIPSYDKDADFDYSHNEYRSIIRRDFERFAVGLGADITAHDDFNEQDKFTWNYRSAGIEGNWRGIYRRTYGTIRPHSHPWEIVGYAQRPTWWYDAYPPSSYAADGTPRYAKTHILWSDLQVGIANADTDLVRPDLALTSPIPVDAVGELIDPITSGMIDIETLNYQTINDEWTYGDGAPVEQTFYESYYYGFAVALAAYLMKPALAVEFLWTDYYKAIGSTGANKLWGAPHIVYRDTLTRPSATDVPLHLTLDTDGNVVRNIGFNSWLAERVAISGGSPQIDFADVIENSQPTLGWRTSTFINKNRTVAEPVTGKEIPFEDTHVVLHQTPAILQTFASGMIIVRQDTGFRVYGYDAITPRFRVDIGAVPSIAGQVEYRQEFTAETAQVEFEITENFELPQKFDTARLGIILNGQRLADKYVRVTGRKTFEINSVVGVRVGDIVVASVVTAISNPSTQMKSFVVRGQRINYFAASSGEVVDYEYGRYFDSVTDVVNMMVGYGRYLSRQGWVFEQVEEGQEIDWLFGAKAFAEWAIRTAPVAASGTPTIESSQFFVSPFSTSAKIKTAFGHIMSVEAIRNGSYGIISRDGTPMRPADTFVSRVGDTLTVELVNTSKAIYGVRVYITEIMHAVFFSNRTKFNDLIYDPVLALYHRVMRVDTYGTANWNGRLEAPGNIIHRGELLPNFEKQTFDFTRLYSRTNPVDDPIVRDEARGLYGYEPQDYMDVIDADDRIKFDHHIGLKATKGSLRAFQAFIRGTRVGTENVSIRENWAWKLAEYGDMKRETVLFGVNKNDFTNERQVIKFESTEDSTGQSIVVTPFVRPQTINGAAPSHPRWIEPPIASATQASSNFAFPVNSNSVPDLDVYSFQSKIIDTVRNETVSVPFHWEPQRGLHEPQAWSAIDEYSGYDPARYNKGPGVANSGGSVWGPERVGSMWLDARKLIYLDPLTYIANANHAARKWGRLLYYKASISRTDEVVTVTTFDPITGSEANHGLSSGQTVSIRGAEQDEYNQSDIEVTVTGATQFTFVTDDTPDTPATGNIIVEIGDVRVYEWVEAPVPPDQWESYIETLTGPDAYTGEVLDPADPSYVEIASRDSNNRSMSLYYYWVRANRRVAVGNELSAYDIENRLKAPQAYGLTFFAPMTRSQMFIYANGEKIDNGFAIQLIADKRELNTHIEWLLLSENSSFRAIPTEMSAKVVDSLCGRTASDAPVPNPTLSETEKYGNLYFPSQTVFRDRTAALAIYVEAVNRLIETKKLEPLDTIVEYLSLSDEKTDGNPDGYWSRDTYRDSTIVGTNVYDTVQTVTERDYRASRGYYANGDLVVVKQSGQLDLWSGDETGVIYRRDGTTWTEVGAENQSFRLNMNVGNDPTVLRAVINRIAAIQSVTLAERNGLMFSVLYEMLRQHPVCDWFMKTSYLTVQVQEDIEKLPYQRRSEADAIFSHILKNKAYRTKVRGEIITGNIAEVEDMAMSLTELPAERIVLTFDRLSCNLIDDGGWDSPAWTSWDDKEWDYPVWYYDDLGRKFYRQVAEITPTAGQSVFNVSVSSGTPLLYDVKVSLLLNDEEVDAGDIGITFTIVRFIKGIRVISSSALNSAYTLKILVAQGFYEGPEPTLGTDIVSEYPTMAATPSSYEHHVARLLRPGVYDPCSEMEGCALSGDELGGDPEERVKSEVTEHVNISVTTEWTPAYAGWDTTPWDTTPWDTPPDDIGDRTFVVLAGPQGVIPAGIEIYPTSETFSKTDSAYVLGSSQAYDIAEVYFDIGTGFVLKTEGTHYRRVSPFSHVIEILPQPDAFYTSDGHQQTITFPEIENAISKVYRNNTLLSAGIDYTVNSTTSITIIDPVLAGDIYRVVPMPYIEFGNAIRFIYNGWDLGVSRGFIVQSYPAMYDVVGTRFQFDEVPEPNQTFTINFTEPRIDTNPRASIVRMDNIVHDALEDHTSYDGVNGFETSRRTGLRVINTVTRKVYEWTGSDWDETATVAGGDIFFVSRQQAIVMYDGTDFQTLWVPGGTYTSPPVLGEPLGGAGLTWGTISYGTMPTASTDYPDAYQVVQHPGDYDG